MITRQASLRYPEDLRVWQDIYDRGDWPFAADNLCAEAIAGFRKFSEKYYNYFEQIINNQEFDRNQTTADRLRARFLQAINDYWSPLGEVAAQRRVQPYYDLLNEITEQAQAYLDKLSLGLPGVLVYFNKVTSIKYCPYARIAFIGTPYTQLIFKDVMAIPHELGHYLYWNLGGSLSEVRQRHQRIKEGAAPVLKKVPELQQLDPAEGAAAEGMVLSWLEETFCDVVGTRLDGVGFIESLQSLIKGSASNADELTENDDCHPPLCIRPFVRKHAHHLNGGTSPVDWDDFFKGTFRIESVRSLELEAPPPNIESLMMKMPKKALVEMLMSEESPMETALPSLQLGVSRLIPAVEALVEFLNAQIGELLKTGLPAPLDPALAFDQLLTLAEGDAVAQSKPPYEILLHPRILEGGVQHGPHSATAHGKSHTVPVHNH